MKTRPEDFPAIFGKNFAHRNNGIVLAIGNRTYNKYDLGAIGCPHPSAPHALHRAIQQLNITSLHDLVNHHSPEDFVLKGFGVTAFYALICVLKDAKIPLRQFYRSKVTFNTLQDKSRKREGMKKKGKKR